MRLENKCDRKNKIIVNNLKDLEFVINGEKFKDGDIVKLNHPHFNQEKREVEHHIVNGIIRFEVYDDGEGYIDDYHLGLLITIKGKREGTLPDLFNEIIFE